jgi:hypothetical protein
MYVYRYVLHVVVYSQVFVMSIGVEDFRIPDHNRFTIRGVVCFQVIAIQFANGLYLLHYTN